MNKKFVIVAVRSYGGGTIVLHTLCKLLDDKGYNAKIFIAQKEFYKKKCTITYMLLCETLDLLKQIICITLLKLGFEKYLQNRGLLNKYCDPIMLRKRKIIPHVSKETIVVYPEIVRSNFLNATNAVKWLLYKDINGWTKKYHAKNELTICYQSVFADDQNDITNKIIRVTYFNNELYKQTNFGKRKGVCYCIRKGKKRKDLPKDFNGLIIDDLTEKEKVQVFNTCEKCYFYDTHTLYSTIATVCGCIPVIVLENNKQKSDYVSKERPVYGIAYGENDIDYAIQTRNKAIEKINRIDIDNEINVTKFIEYINEWYLS